MKAVRGKVAAITGAASGIGRATAVLLAGKGASLALADLNEAGLLETAAQCEALGVKVTTRRVDVAKREEVFAWADSVPEAFGGVNIVINNAGVGVAATVEDVSYEDFEWLMGINFWGVVHGTKAFLPHLRKSGDGHIVNISSVFGLIGVPTQAAYNAAKFAVKGFTECLRQELQVERAPIGVTCVHPGGIRTNIAKSSRLTERAGWVDAQSAQDFEKMFATSPEKAAHDILAAILGNRPRQLIGWDARIIDVAQRLMPTLYQRILVTALRRRLDRMLGAGVKTPTV